MSQNLNQKIEENKSSTQVTRYSVEDFVKDEIQLIKEKFGVELEIVQHEENGKYNIVSTWILERGRIDFNATKPLDTLEEVKNVLVGMYSVLYVKDMSEAEL